jgi:hexokinase
MGKGFAISSDQDLGGRLTDGYNRAKSPELPPIRVEAIANDSVSTLVSFIFNFDEALNRRACMGLILGTGCNATIPLKLSQLNSSKRPPSVVARPEERAEDVKIAINTEWSINGTSPPLHKVGLVTKWDKVLDQQGELNSFQPLEYLTSGRYLGELGRIMLVDYLTEHLDIAAGTLPKTLLQRHNLTTTYLSHFKPLRPSALMISLQQEFPESSGSPPFEWTEDIATALYRIAKAIEVRAAGIVAAATLALLTLAGEVPRDGARAMNRDCELGVGYTGGCIVHFQDYLQDCQDFLDQLLSKRFGDESPLRVVLSPCHDGGVTGAGILVAAASQSKTIKN